MPRARRLSLLLSACLLLTVGLVGGAPQAGAVAVTEEYAVDAAGSLTLTGGGYGHGRGMSQYGAQGAALQGLTSQQILDFYYPGTTTGSAPATIRVKIDDKTSGGRVAVNGSVAGAAYATDSATGVTWSIGSHAYLQVSNRAGATTVEVTDGLTYTTALGVAAGAVRLGVTSGDLRVVYADGSLRTVRGTVRAAASTSPVGFYPVNDLGMDDYLAGVVPAEMPASWQPAALQAQAIAARTYAAAYALRKPSPDWDICATTTCQVYRGKDAEASGSTAAIVATSGMVRVYGGALISTEFSSSNGGFTASGGTAYTPARTDPYDGFSGNPVHRWTATVTQSQLRAAFPSVGSVLSLRVTSRVGEGPWGGRVLTATVVGAAGTQSLTGEGVRTALGLRSTLFTGPMTAILGKWSALGGVSYLGAPTSGEYAIGSMRAQDFVNGTLYLTSTGVWCVFGALNTHYRSTGGPALWGVPTADSTGVTGGAVSTFSAGRIYWSSAAGAAGIRGAFLARFVGLGGLSLLGFPTGNEVATSYGSAQTFQRGQLHWNGSAALAVVGAIHSRYAALGGAAVYGPPASDEVADGTARMQPFTLGRFYWSPAGGAHPVFGAVLSRFVADGTVAVDGAPTTDEAPVGAAVEQGFTGAQLSWSSGRGSRRVYGAIRAAYLQAGGSASLGLPLTEEAPTATGAQQTFERAVIVWSPQTGAVVTRT
ncbi:MAG TPA: SpoIID/LytB domain-containing protein [Dermatophilaceae bacterium]|nr:SpoIID/LytB domain-containing protein [Dermatophilaceae bacterium]